MKAKRLTASFIAVVFLLGNSFTLANAAPKCSGTNLTKYKKAVRQEAAAWKEIQDVEELNNKYVALTGVNHPKYVETHSLAYKNWLDFGYALAKYAKICKMKMRPEWYEMLDSLPVS